MTYIRPLVQSAKRTALRERYKNDAEYRERTLEFQRKYYHEKRKGILKEYRRKPHKRYRYAVRNARYENREFTLTEAQYVELIAKPCFYCTGPLPETGRGLDRIDNSRGYHIDNVLPCCTQCNNTRNTFYTVEETKAMITALLQFRKGTRI